MIKELLENLLNERGPGPYPSFSIIHLLKAFELIAERGPLGRGKLSSELKLGEGAIRTLIGRMKDAELTTVSKPGCSLTSKGEKIWREFKSIFPRKVKLEKSELSLASYEVAVLIRGCGHKVGAGIGQRDAAIKAGAKGAITLIFKDEKLILPTISENVAVDYPIVYNQITRLMDLRENDVVIIGSADTLSGAEYGTLAAAWSIIDDCG